MSRLRVLVAGCGNMGASHARAYRDLDAFDVVGLVSRGAESRERIARDLGDDVATFADFELALQATQPNCVSINTYPDTHAEFATLALEAGAHVFLEKPIATTVEAAQAVVALAKARKRKLVVGYILRVHPAWQRFIELARTLGKPLVMRMNLNQQSAKSEWETHKNLLRSMSPIVDCGVHYVDVMCQMTRAKPLRVSAVGARLSDEIADDRFNYGQLQVTFDDGSIGWYEAGWGPMMSEVAYFVKDVIGPNGSVSIVDRGGEERTDASSDIDSHTATQTLLIHSAERDATTGEFVRADQTLDTSDEPDHDELCRREQDWFGRAIREDLDLTDHLADAVNSLRIVLAAEQSAKQGVTVDL